MYLKETLRGNEALKPRVQTSVSGKRHKNRSLLSKFLLPSGETREIIITRTFIPLAHTVRVHVHKCRHMCISFRSSGGEI